MFKALEREETLAARVTEQLEAFLTESHVLPGERISAERVLAEQFKVSRTVVREAVRSLVAKGLLEVKPGSGTHVSTPSAERVTETMSWFLRGNGAEIDLRKVSEVRRLLEVEIAGLAAERRTDEDLAEMRRILDDMTGVTRDRERFVEWDMAFHSALAAATHNDLFSILLGSVVSTLRKVRELGFNVPGTPERAKSFHELILEKVREGNPTAARAAMRDHMSEAERTMQQGMERAPRARKR
jgi:GntR family transcriptional regulator, transcriptional repressor for pyruvate dehydrogenase complex